MVSREEMDQELREEGFTEDQIEQAQVPISAAEMVAYEEDHLDDADRQFYRDRDRRREAAYQAYLKSCPNLSP